MGWFRPVRAPPLPPRCLPLPRSPPPKPGELGETATVGSSRPAHPASVLSPNIPAPLAAAGPTVGGRGEGLGRRGGMGSG